MRLFTCNEMVSKADPDYQLSVREIVLLVTAGIKQLKAHHAKLNYQAELHAAQDLHNKSLVLKLFVILDDADFDDGGNGRGDLSPEDLQQGIDKLDDVVHENPQVRSIMTRFSEA